MTGGAGFLGSHTVRGLSAAGHEPIVLDDLSSGNRDGIPLDVPMVEADVRDARAVSKVLGDFRPHATVHLAARPIGAWDLRPSTDDAAVNVLGALTVANASAAAGVEHYVFASSAAVYGELCAGEAYEEDVKHPRSANGAAKAAAEELLLIGSTRAIPTVTALRFANLYGPGAMCVAQSAVQSFVELIGAGESPIIYGDGSQTRDFVFVGDAAGAIVATVAAKPRGVFNVGTGVESSLLDLARMVADTMGVEAIDPSFRAERPNDVRRSCLSPSRMAAATGFRATTSLSMGLSVTVQSRRATILQV